MGRDLVLPAVGYDDNVYRVKQRFLRRLPRKWLALLPKPGRARLEFTRCVALRGHSPLGESVLVPVDGCGNRTEPVAGTREWHVGSVRPLCGVVI